MMGLLWERFSGRRAQPSAQVSSAQMLKVDVTRVVVQLWNDRNDWGGREDRDEPRILGGV